MYKITRHSQLVLPRHILELAKIDKGDYVDIQWNADNQTIVITPLELTIKVRELNP